MCSRTVAADLVFVNHLVGNIELLVAKAPSVVVGKDHKHLDCEFNVAFGFGEINIHEIIVWGKIVVLIHD